MNKTKSIYTLLIVIGILSCLYSYFTSSIKPAIYPDEWLKRLSPLSTLGKPSKIETQVLSQDNSDRSLSKLYAHSFSDSSKVLSVLSRVRKRDDFRIETYGLLTKDVSQIYLDGAQITAQKPFSLIGRLNNKTALQTCIIPGSKDLQHIDVRLNELTSGIDLKSPPNNGILWKIVGRSTPKDYSCLVVTFIPSPALSQQEILILWPKLLASYQNAIKP